MEAHDPGPDLASPPFMPRSVIDRTEAAVTARRKERDVESLNVHFCLYLKPEEVTQLPVALVDEFATGLQPLEGKLLTIPPERVAQVLNDYQHQIPHHLIERFSQPQLPPDLWGYAFFIAPLSPLAITTKDLQDRGNRMVLNGDGMVYRLGFKSGQVNLKTRIMKTPCYYIDVVTQLGRKFKHLRKFDPLGLLRFVDGGLVRLNLILGTRTQMNTAFMPTKEHLLVTFDAGRPHLLDPESLEILQPIGTPQDWTSLASALMPPFIQQVFQPYSNPAHPLCDHSQLDTPDEVITANLSQGLGLLAGVNALRKWLLQKLHNRDEVLLHPWGGFTDLIRYRFDTNELKKWRLVLPNREPVIIEHAAHQMALSQDWIVIGDIAFEMEVSQIFYPYLFAPLRVLFLLPLLRWFSSPINYWFSLLFFRLVRPQPFANLYLIRRADLDRPPEVTIDGLPVLVATKVTLPREVSHFTADYNRDDGQLVLHVAHANGWDVTEWIGEYDESLDPQIDDPKKARQLARATEWLFQIQEAREQQGRKALRPDLKGMQMGPVDLNALARYTIDANTIAIIDNLFVADPGSHPAGGNTWSPSVLTHRNLRRDSAIEPESLQTVKNIYWMSWGFSWEITPRRIYRAYKNRDVRTIPAERLPQDDRPMTLIRLDTEWMKIADCFEFPIGCFARAPQYIPSHAPCPPGIDLSIHGYIVCTVMSDGADGQSQDEFWVFHADDFKGKPIYRLSYPQSNLALVIHSTWLPDQRVEKPVRGERSYTDLERQQMRREYLERDYRQLIQNNPLTRPLYDLIEYDFIVQTLEQEWLEKLSHDAVDQKG